MRDSIPGWVRSFGTDRPKNRKPPQKQTATSVSSPICDDKRNGCDKCERKVQRYVQCINTRNINSTRQKSGVRKG